MRASVIICTYNRCESLRRTLETLSLMVVPPGLDWELLIVDNNSKDATKQACADFQQRLPLRYLFESKQGKSHALNLAVAVAKADLLIFCDDDVDVDPELDGAAIGTGRGVIPKAAFFSGRVIPRWETTPPNDGSGELSRQRRCCAGSTVCYEPSDREMEIPATHHWTGLRSESLLCVVEMLGQRAGVGLSPGPGPSGGEQVRFEAKRPLFVAAIDGKRVSTAFICPEPSFIIEIHPERMTEKYVRD